MFVVSTYNEIQSYPINRNCTVTLAVMSYKTVTRCSKLFINCKTQDGYEVVCCGYLMFHNPEREPKRGDVVELQNVQPYVLSNGRFGDHKQSLWIHDHSIVSIINPENGSKTQIIPKIPLLPPIFPERHNLQYSRAPSVVSCSVQKPVKDKKVIGIIENKITVEKIMEDDPDYKHGAYVTTLLLFDESQIKLIISKKFGNWPGSLLRPRDIVSVIGEKADYYGMEVRLVRPGNHLDIASKEEIAFAQQELKFVSRNHPVGRKN